MSLNLPVDWTYLALRLFFVLLLYLFIWRVLRVTVRDLVNAASSDPSPKKRRLRARLLVLDAAQSPLIAGASFTVSRRSVVGRHSSCDVVLDDPSVSARHAELVPNGSDWLVLDLGSTNGTFVRDSPAPGPTTVNPGDAIQFGRVKLQLLNQPE